MPLVNALVYGILVFEKVDDNFVREAASSTLFDFSARIKTPEDASIRRMPTGGGREQQQEELQQGHQGQWARMMMMRWIVFRMLMKKRIMIIMFSMRSRSRMRVIQICNCFKMIARIETIGRFASHLFYFFFKNITTTTSKNICRIKRIIVVVAARIIREQL